MALVVSCGGSSSSPSSPTAPTPSQTRSIAGRITDILSGSGVPGASVAIAGAPTVQTGSDGSWRVDVPPPSTERLLTKVTATGFQVRETYVTWTNSARQDVGIDLLPERAPFSLPFYRELVRNRMESPASLEPVRRWTTNPNIYLRTLNPKTNQPLSPSEVDSLLQSVREGVSQITGGLLSVGSVESGIAARPERAGTINISIVYEPDGEFCGTSYVGANPGSVEFNYGLCARECGGRDLGPELIAHEIGHAVGFWHVSEGVMQAEGFVNCGTINFTAAERLHGSIAYRRPSGNLDIDKDPQSFSALTAPGSAPLVQCRRGH